MRWRAHRTCVNAKFPHQVDDDLHYPAVGPEPAVVSSVSAAKETLKRKRSDTVKWRVKGHAYTLAACARSVVPDFQTQSYIFCCCPACLQHGQAEKGVALLLQVEAAVELSGPHRICPFAWWLLIWQVAFVGKHSASF